MNAVFLFILKSVLVSGILTGYYWIVLRNKKFHQYNRFYLLFTLYASIQLPLLQVKWFTIYKPQQVIPDAPSEITEQVVIPVAQTDWNTIVLTACLSVSAVLLSVLLMRIIYILKLKRKYDSTKLDGISLVHTDLPKAPFSFLNNLFWRQDILLSSPGGKQIFQHELAHITQKHTYDKLISQVLVCIGWFNPFYWLLQREINMIHEFLADQKAVQDGDTESFALMLLQVHNSGQYLNPSHPFSYSPISRRLSMIIRSKKTSFPYLRKLVLLPLLFLIVIPFSFTVKTVTEIEHTLLNNNTVSTTDTIIPKKPATINKVVLPVAPNKSQPFRGVKPSMPGRVLRVSKLPANPVLPVVPSEGKVPAVGKPSANPASPSPPKQNGQPDVNIQPPGAAPGVHVEDRTGTIKNPPGMLKEDVENRKSTVYSVVALNIYNKEGEVKITERITKQEQNYWLQAMQLSQQADKHKRKNKPENREQDRGDRLLDKKKPGKHKINNEVQREVERDRQADPDRKKHLDNKKLSVSTTIERFNKTIVFGEGDDDFFNRRGDPFKQAGEFFKLSDDFLKTRNEQLNQREDLMKQADELWKQREELWKHRDEPWKHNDKEWNLNGKKPAS